MEKELADLSLSLFGTADYESALSVLPAYDGAVKEFRAKEREILKKHDERNE